MKNRVICSNSVYIFCVKLSVLPDQAALYWTTAICPFIFYLQMCEICVINEEVVTCVCEYLFSVL